MFEPYPIVYRWKIWVIATIGLALYWTIQFFRVVVHDQEFVSSHMAINIGDSVTIPAFLLSAGLALRGHKMTQVRFYHRKAWYFAVAAATTIAMLGLKMMRGFPMEAELEPEQFIHDMVFVPFYAILIAGVLPHIIFDLKGKIPVRVMAVMAFAAYITTFCMDLVN